MLIKVLNHATCTAALRVLSRQAGPPYAGVAKSTLERERQTALGENPNVQREDRFLEIDPFTAPPMTPALSGLEVEYVIAVVYSSEAGKREAVLAFDVGQGTQDLGFRAELPVLFDVRPAVNVRLSVRDFDGQPTTARLTFTDAQGHVFPPQARRLAPDFFFQKQIYRADGGTVLLPPGVPLTMEASRGPEYRTVKQPVTISPGKEARLDVQLERWIHPADFGWYSGDHHIHSAGCAHYTSPAEGMLPEHMFAQIKGEGLNVGCVLAWGYGFEFQRGFFGAQTHALSEPLTQMKYDVEVSGFGSGALGHVCLLNLRELVYPGADGIKGWPTWTTPTLRWTKQQGGVTGYPHSGSGMQVTPATAAKRMLEALDTNKDGRISREEAADALLPAPFEKIDADRDGALNETELTASHERVVDQLPNVAVPDAGGHEIFVSTAMGACDFISAMDTARLLEWNAWYHLMNCGLPLKCAGETDYPCMSGTRVGQGRTYVQLGHVERVDFTPWIEGLARGRSYVSDGYAHALEFAVEGKSAGDEVQLAQPARV
ncbi:MAG TPA: CehA/McbA family metallohydrolase, partial [Steroidobacteraceae bacterium]